MKENNINDIFKQIKNDYTAYAESRILLIVEDNEKRRRLEPNINRHHKIVPIKAAQLRSLYSLIVPILTILDYRQNIDENHLSTILRNSKVKMAYQIGRDQDDDIGVRIFNDFTHIFDLIDVVLESDNFLVDLRLYCNYFEALVAYHRYHSYKWGNRT